VLNYYKKIKITKTWRRVISDKAAEEMWPILHHYVLLRRAGEPESERPEPHDVDGAGAISFFLQEPEHFKKLE